jgi:hypothetical protein
MSPGLLRSIIASMPAIGLSAGGLICKSRRRTETRALSLASCTCSTDTTAETNIAAPITLTVADARSPGATAASCRSLGSLPRATLPSSHCTASIGTPKRMRVALTMLRSRKLGLLTRYEKPCCRSASEMTFMPSRLQQMPRHCHQPVCAAAARPNRARLGLPAVAKRENNGRSSCEASQKSENKGRSSCEASQKSENKGRSGCVVSQKRENNRCRGLLAKQVRYQPPLLRLFAQ